MDYYVDNITGTDEPIGATRALNFETDGVNFQINDINFSILSPLYEPRPPCDNDRTITINGDVTLTETYIGGDVAVMLMQPGNEVQFILSLPHTGRCLQATQSKSVKIMATCC